MVRRLAAGCLLLSVASSASAAEWKPAGVTAKRVEPGAFVTSTGKVVVYGGGTIVASDVFDASAGTWTVGTAPYLYVSRMPVPLGADAFLVAAGNVGQVWSGDVFSPSLSSSDGTRANQSAVLLADGRVLVTGGRDWAGTPEVGAASRIYDPKGKTWSDAAPMNEPRADHGIALLAGGQVLVVGGYNASSAGLSTAELFDPLKNMWTTVSPTSRGRMTPIVIPLPDGKAALIGGIGTSLAPNIEIFDPATKNWSMGSALATPRSQATGVRVGDRWMIAGGLGSKGDAIPDVEWFDPATRTSTKGVPMLTARVDGFAVALPFSGVLVGGGATRIDGAATVLTTAERYFPDTADAGADSGSTDATVGDGSVADSAPVDATAPRPPGDKPVLAGTAQRCGSGSECASGHCVDGVCCNTACADRCHSCALPTSPGTCVASPAGVDLRGECGVAKACVGTCDGAGACIGAGPGSMCARARCDGPTKGLGASYCAAAGVPCDESSAVAFDCAPFICEPAFGACTTLCSKSADCAPGYACDLGSRMCYAPGSKEDDSGCAVSTVGAPAPASLLVLVGALGALGRRQRRPHNKRR